MDMQPFLLPVTNTFVREWLRVHNQFRTNSYKLHPFKKCKVFCSLIKTMDGDIGSWVRSIPIVTRYWFFAFFALPLTTRLGLIAPINLILISERTLGGFEVSQFRLVLKCEKSY